MTAPEPMTREELLELAGLDALGLLDEYEAALFTRSFHHAPVAVQDEVKRLQAAFASDKNLLPEVEPSTELREKVLAAVSKAIESESIELAPLAMIGPRARGGRESGSRLALSASTPLWRAAAFVLAGVGLVLAYFNLQLRERNEEIIDHLIGMKTTEQVEALLGPDFNSFQSPYTLVRVLNPVPGSTNMHATVFVNENTKQAFLLAVGLPDQSAPFTLTATSADGQEQFSRGFERMSVYTGIRLGELPTVSMVASLTWEITDATGRTILRA